MKKIVIGIFSVVFALCIAGCTGSGTTTDNSSKAPEPTPPVSSTEYKLSDYVGVYESTYYDQYTKTYITYYVVLAKDGTAGVFIQNSDIGTWDKSGIYMEGNKVYDISINTEGERQELHLSDGKADLVYYMTDVDPSTFFPTGFGEEGDPEWYPEGPSGASNLDPTCFVSTWSANSRTESVKGMSTQTVWSDEDNNLYAEIKEYDGQFYLTAYGRKDGRVIDIGGALYINNESGLFCFVYDGEETSGGTYDILKYRIRPIETWEPNVFPNHTPEQIYVYPGEGWEDGDYSSIKITCMYYDRDAEWIASCSYNMVKTVG